MQGTWVWCLVWKDSMCLVAAKPVPPQLLKASCPRAQALIWEATTRSPQSNRGGPLCTATRGIPHKAKKTSTAPTSKSHFYAPTVSHLTKKLDSSIHNSLSSVQSLSCVWLFATPWTAARQASLSITNSWSPPKPMSIESVMPPNHLILCRPLLLLPSILPSIWVFSNESALCIRWPKYWSFSFNISPSSEHPGQQHQTTIK